MEKTKAAARAEELVRRTVDYLRQEIRVDQAVLFGSHATGDADEWSDVDLAVVSPDFSRMSHPNFLGHILATGKVVYKNGEFLL